jgi:hypothetical protein
MRRAYPDWVPTPASSSVVLTFEQATPEAVDAMVNKLRELSAVVKVEPWDTFWEQRYASVVDPDGNQVDVWSWLPKQQETKPQPRPSEGSTAESAPQPRPTEVSKVESAPQPQP